DIRTVYQRDRNRIIHSKSFRRLKHKTQVFIAPIGDHYRTRLTHTLEVSQLSRTVSRALRLNDDLTEAIALGHDLGHTPFGHAGERALNEVCPFGFRHYEQSIRVVEKLERDGRGLNLTKEVRDGILNHQWGLHPSTLEGQIVRFCDKIAYINHDIDDAERAGIMTEEDIPDRFRKSLGESTKERLDTLINDIIYQSIDSDEIRMSPDIQKEMEDLRHFMYENLYTDSIAKIEEKKVPVLLKILYQYYEQHIDEMPDEYVQLIRNGEAEPRVVCDYISGMTDPYAVQKFEELFIPKSWPKQ
ncbi:MAG: deoxyguanosinetriphosphate triphosphohydrolase, partial [Lachnospiraceae bacterium]|nr:deoxyguanosinetriphosphate triphosphohydrolase [Lachnospiraceae bacterium]